MKKCVKIAHHISGFWRPHLTKDPSTTGSLGAGLLISPYLEACLEESVSFSFFINGEKIRLEPALNLIEDNRERIGNFRLEIKEPLPLGRGYATSASITMSIALLALQKMTFLERMDQAHMSEVKSLTGLGDVSSIVHGHDLSIRLVAGSPSIARVNSIPINNNVRITTVILRNYTTTDMLRERMNLFIEYGEKSWRRLLEAPSLELFVELSREFSYRTGMMKNIEKPLSLLEKLGKDAIIGVFVKKGILVIVHEASYEEDISSLLLKGFSGNSIFTHNIVWNGIIS